MSVKNATEFAVKFGKMLNEVGGNTKEIIAGCLRDPNLMKCIAMGAINNLPVSEKVARKIMNSDFICSSNQPIFYSKVELENARGEYVLVEVPYIDSDRIDIDKFVEGREFDMSFIRNIVFGHPVCRWHLIRKEPLNRSMWKSYLEQDKFLRSNEKIPSAWELIYTSVSYYHKNGKQLYGNAVRASDKIDGKPVYVISKSGGKASICLLENENVSSSVGVAPKLLPLYYCV